MKNLSITLFVLSLVLITPLFPVEKIEIGTGKAITVDGKFSTDEWTDAKSLAIILDGGKEITVFYKHDNSNLYLAYCSNLMSGNSVHLPEVMFDLNNDKSNSWMSDDWWFHVSATDCYSKGVYGDYSTCKLVQEDWEANNVMESNFKDTVEIIIPFNTIGIDPSGIKTIGICFDGTDTQTEWKYWPSAADKSNPAGWAEATINFTGTAVEFPEVHSISIIPNPANGFIQLNGNIREESTITIYSVLGSKVLETAGKEVIEVGALPIGLYYIRIENNNQSETKMLMIGR